MSPRECLLPRGARERFRSAFRILRAAGQRRRTVELPVLLRALEVAGGSADVLGSAIIACASVDASRPRWTGDLVAGWPVLSRVRVEAERRAAQ